MGRRTNVVADRYMAVHWAAFVDEEFVSIDDDS